MRRLEHAINVDDLKQMAKRRLPKIIFDFIEGGVDDEVALTTNANTFSQVRLVPRYLTGAASRDLSVKLFDRTYSVPVGIGPTGMAGTFARDAELHFAQVAAEANIPYLMSGASNASMEEGAKHAPDHLWFQLYIARNRDMMLDLVKRAIDAGLSTIAVTCDVPVTPNRERNRRNGFSHPLRLTVPVILEAIRHPAWAIEYFASGGLPNLGNWSSYAAEGATPLEVASLFASQTPDASQSWHDLETIRKAWSGKLLLKGVLHPEDARVAAAMGVDGLIVSNHGGRQLDLAPSSLEMLPLIRAVVGADMPLILDSGIRRGSDIVAALCLGADFVLAGRTPLYGAIAGGLDGVRKSISILKSEMDLVMGQLGARDTAMLGPEFLLDSIKRPGPMV